MSMKRCENGHYFDSEKHTACPSCGVRDLHIEPTIPRGKSAGAATAPNQAGHDVPTTRPRGGHAPVARPEREPAATVGLVPRAIGIDPVVGWLVCVEGTERGRDYRIRSERNFIGRDAKMDICVGGDDAISRENHAIVSFDPKRQTFRLLPGEGRGIVYLNGEEVAAPAPLQAYDAIELGQTKLLFIPFCGEMFKWTPRRIR